MFVISVLGLLIAILFKIESNVYNLKWRKVNPECVRIAKAELGKTANYPGYIKHQNMALFAIRASFLISVISVIRLIWNA